MRNLVNGIKTFKKPKGDGKRDLGGSMVFLQLYHASKLTNKESDEFITEGNISPVKFDEDTNGVYDTNEEMDTMELMNGLIDKICNKIMGHLDLRFVLDEKMKVDEKMTQVVHEKMKVDEKMTQVVHEEKEVIVIREELDEDMKHVGPFAIRTSKVPHDRWCKYLEHCYENVEDIKDIAGVEDNDCFHVNKKRFFEELMPGKWLSNVLINHVTDVLNIRQIRKSDFSDTPIQRWYFPTIHRGHRIYSPKSKMKYQIKIEQLRGMKQIFFPLLRNNHWNLIVFNNEERQVEVWDSLESNLEDFLTDINFLCGWLDGEITQEVRFKTYARALFNMPKQSNVYDCGVYVCRSMEYPDEVMEFHTEKWISTEQRCLLAMRILKASENTVSVGWCRQTPLGSIMPYHTYERKCYSTSRRYY